MAQFPANIDLSTLNGTTGFKLSGVAAYDYSGFSVASAGDVNGDGFADLIVGAPGPTRSASFRRELRGVRPSLGLCRQYRSLLARRHDRLHAQRRGGWRPQRLLGRFGRRRQRRRFRRPDRRRYRADPHGYSSGASYVVFGKASGFAANIDLSALDGTTGFKLSGVAANDFSGSSVASAGDVNGDGFADLIVGARGAGYSGASYVVFGQLPDTAVNRTGTGAGADARRRRLRRHAVGPRRRRHALRATAATTPSTAAPATTR